MLYIVSTTPTFSFFFTSVLGCGEESASYQRDEEIHKQIYFLFVGFVEQFKRSYDMVILFIHLNGFNNGPLYYIYFFMFDWQKRFN
jgi:hypothetical protein